MIITITGTRAILRAAIVLAASVCVCVCLSVHTKSRKPLVGFRSWCNLVKIWTMVNLRGGWKLVAFDLWPWELYFRSYSSYSFWMAWELRFRYGDTSWEYLYQDSFKVIRPSSRSRRRAALCSLGCSVFSVCSSPVLQSNWADHTDCSNCVCLLTRVSQIASRIPLSHGLRWQWSVNCHIFSYKGKGKGKCIAVCINTYTATGNHTVLPATRQRWLSRLYPSRSWYSI